MHPLGLQTREEALGIGLAGHHLHLLGLVGKLEEVGRVDAPVLAETLAAGDQRRPRQTQITRQEQQPLAQRLAVMALVLLGEEGDLITVHAISSKNPRSGRAAAVRATGRSRIGGLTAAARAARTMSAYHMRPR